MYSPLTTSSRQDFILLRLKNLNKDIKFIEKNSILFCTPFPLADKALSITLPRSQFFLQKQQ
ncbi:hypothetical protein SG76_06165 [Enterobacter hormaechei subsp. steigerwaltii]|nr:hypothetical protein SG76_06165 [Enterobacter hormaechei subsp. steigerwaltii]